MDKIINILLLIIIFVFDPLAISLVVAANFAFDKARPRKNLYGETEDKEEKDTLFEEAIKEAKEVKIKDIEVDVEVVKPYDEARGTKPPEKLVTRILQKSPSKNRVKFDDGSTGWVDKSDNTIRYL